MNSFSLNHFSTIHTVLHLVHPEAVHTKPLFSPVERTSNPNQTGQMYIVLSTSVCRNDAFYKYAGAGGATLFLVLVCPHKLYCLTILLLVLLKQYNINSVDVLISVKGSHVHNRAFAGIAMLAKPPSEEAVYASKRSSASTAAPRPQTTLAFLAIPKAFFCWYSCVYTGYCAGITCWLGM